MNDDTAPPAGSTVDMTPMAAIDIGWLVCAPGDQAARATADEAGRLLLSRLQEIAPDYAWQWHSLEGECPPDAGGGTDVMRLVDSGLAHREAHRLDFQFVISAGPLNGLDGRRMIAASSSAVAVAVMSLQPPTLGDSGSRAEALSGLAGCLLAQMLGLEAPADGGAEAFSDAGRAELNSALARVADARVEERGIRAGVMFYLASVAENWREMAWPFIRERRWMIPFRLSRLTAAAASALFILMLTAEVWELGMAQSAGTVLILSLLALGGTSLFVLKKQQLLAPARSHRLTEQIAVMRVAVTLGVFSGMLSTYLLIFVAAFIAALGLFPAGIVTAWSGLSIDRVDGFRYAVFSGFVSALGVIIGALGASFERQGYLKQLALLDCQIDAAP